MPMPTGIGLGRPIKHPRAILGGRNERRNGTISPDPSVAGVTSAEGHHTDEVEGNAFWHGEQVGQREHSDRH